MVSYPVSGKLQTSVVAKLDIIGKRSFQQLLEKLDKALKEN